MRKAVEAVQLLGLSDEQRAQTFKEIAAANLQHAFIVRYFHSWESEDAGQ